MELQKILKFNPNHDPKTGQFTSGGKGAITGGAGGFTKTFDSLLGKSKLVPRDYKGGNRYSGTLSMDEAKGMRRSFGDHGFKKTLDTLNTQVFRRGEDDAEITMYHDKNGVATITLRNSSTSSAGSGRVATKDLKKGTRVMLDNGFEADLFDNKTGKTRLAKVYGIVTEIGSVYTHDIVAAKDGDSWKDVELTDAEKKFKKKIRAMGF